MAIARRELVWSSVVPLTASQVRQWHSTPIEAAPAPGVGRIIVPFLYTVYLAAGTVPFSAAGNVGQTLSIATPSGAGDGISGIDQTLTRTVNHYYVRPTLAEQDNAADADVNQPLTATLSVNLAAGGATTTTLNAAGLLYAPLDIGTIIQGSNQTAVYRVDTVGAGGAVTGFTITTVGTGYTAANGLSTDTSGAGSGFKINITAVTPGNGTVRLATTYRLLRTN